MGLERAFMNLYGSKPQIDLDKQVARCRVPKPMTLDFKALFDGITRANVGTAAIVVRASGEVKDGRVTLAGTGQAFPLEGSAAAAGPALLELKVHAWEDPARTRLEVVKTIPK